MADSSGVWIGLDCVVLYWAPGLVMNAGNTSARGAFTGCLIGGCVSVTQLLIEVPNFVYGFFSRGFLGWVFFFFFGGIEYVADRLGHHLEHIEASPAHQMALSQHMSSYRP